MFIDVEGIYLALEDINNQNQDFYSKIYKKRTAPFFNFGVEQKFSYFLVKEIAGI